MELIRHDDCMVTMEDIKFGEYFVRVDDHENKLYQKINFKEIQERHVEVPYDCGDAFVLFSWFERVYRVRVELHVFMDTELIKKHQHPPKKSSKFPTILC